MKLEDAIHQSKPFASQHEKAIVNIIYTHGWLNGEMQAYFKKFGLTGKQYNILRILKGANKPISTSALKKRLLDKSSDVSRIVSRMASKGLIKKNACETDKRLVDVVLSSKGKSVLDKVDKHRKSLLEIMSGLSKKDAQTLNGLLDKLRSK